MYYGFHRIPASDGEREASTALARRLLGITEGDECTRKSGFEYKVCLPESQALRRYQTCHEHWLSPIQNITWQEGHFLHPIIASVMYDAFFTHDGALGCANQSASNPIRHQTLALVLTAVCPLVDAMPPSKRGLVHPFKGRTLHLKILIRHFQQEYQVQQRLLRGIRPAGISRPESTCTHRLRSGSSIASYSSTTICKYAHWP